MTPTRWYSVTYVDMDEPPGSPARTWTVRRFDWPDVGDAVPGPAADGRRRFVQSVYSDTGRADAVTVAVGRAEESAFDMECVWPLERAEAA